MRDYLLAVLVIHLALLLVWTLFYIFREKEKDSLTWLFFMHLSLILLVFGALGFTRL